MKDYGKIVKYDGFAGEIISENGKFIFFNKDVLTEDIKVNDYVVFRGELVLDTKKAFFINKINKEHKKLEIKNNNETK